MTINQLPTLQSPSASAVVPVSQNNADYKMTLVALNNALIDVSSSFKIFSSVTQLGLTSGSATIARAWSALGKNEMLVCPASEFASAQVPSTSGCMVEIVKRFADGSSGRINFYGRSEAIGDYRMFVGGSPFTPTGTWKKLTYT